MRIPLQDQLTLDCPPVIKVQLNPECRDRMIPILRGLQHLYSHTEFRNQALTWIADDVLEEADPNRGREGMTYWQILVLGAVRLGCNFTYDHLQDLAENHRALLQIMQVGCWEEASFDWRRIRDNISKVRPETIEKINHLIVAAGHQLQPTAAEQIRGDTFVADTNIHYPTESSLLLDGLTKILESAPSFAKLLGVTGWRQHKSLLKKARQAAREVARVKKGKNFQARLTTAYQKLFKIVEMVLPRTQELLDAAFGLLPEEEGTSLPSLEACRVYQELFYWHAVTSHVYGTACRRILQDETVPNEDKIFSLFEPDTELIKRGKLAKPIEFGHRVMVIEDAVGFICHYKILPIGSDERDELLPEMQTLQDRLNQRIERASFDRGFHSPANQKGLAELFAHPCLPMTGAKQSARQDAKATIEFRQSRQRHPGVESAIHALQSGNGLSRCRDHSQPGYARYIGLGILGRNLLVLGKLLLAHEHPKSEAAKTRRKPAA